MAGEVQAGYISARKSQTATNGAVAITFDGISDSNGWIDVRSFLYASLFIDYGGTSNTVIMQGKVEGGPEVQVSSAAHTAGGYVSEKVDIAKFTHIRWTENGASGTNVFHLVVK